MRILEQYGVSLINIMNPETRKCGKRTKKNTDGRIGLRKSWAGGVVHENKIKLTLRITVAIDLLEMAQISSSLSQKKRMEHTARNQRVG